MLDHKTIDDIAQKISAAMPDSLRSLSQDVDKNIRAIVQSTLSKLDLVTRQELDVQKEVLLRTRSQLQALEQQLAALESRLELTSKPGANRQD